MIRCRSNAFIKCSWCGKVIKPKEEYLWDEDLDLVQCLDCDEAYWESLILEGPPEPEEVPFF